jgi:hypothetical protein
MVAGSRSHIGRISFFFYAANSHTVIRSDFLFTCGLLFALGLGAGYGGFSLFEIKHLIIPLLKAFRITTILELPNRVCVLMIKLQDQSWCNNCFTFSRVLW